MNRGRYYICFAMLRGKFKETRLVFEGLAPRRRCGKAMFESQGSIHDEEARTLAIDTSRIGGRLVAEIFHALTIEASLFQYFLCVPILLF